MGYNLSELTRLPATQDFQWSGPLSAETRTVVIVNGLSAAVLVNLGTTPPSYGPGLTDPVHADAVVPGLSRVVIPAAAAGSISLLVVYADGRIPEREGIGQALVYEADASLAPRTDYLHGPSAAAPGPWNVNNLAVFDGLPLQLSVLGLWTRRGVMVQSVLENTGVVYVSNESTGGGIEVWPGESIWLPLAALVDLWAVVPAGSPGQTLRVAEL